MAIIALIDVETTHLDHTIGEIIEIGLVVFDSRTGQILDKFELKIKPEHIANASPEALKVNGYNEKEWENSYSLEEALQHLSDKVKDTTMMSYNVSFDAGFLQTAYRSLGMEYPFQYHHFDLLTLAWCKIPHYLINSWSLKNVCKTLDIPPEPKRHRAMGGVMAAYKVYIRLMI